MGIREECKNDDRLIDEPSPDAISKMEFYEMAKFLGNAKLRPDCKPDPKDHRANLRALYLINCAHCLMGSTLISQK